jgi:3-deoxy-manno-octulosonate cytidylyltransferase (CMP-KDO synthetase)
VTTDFTVVIPARYAATRLPGKMLANIAGKPMLQHVFDRAQESNAKQILIATDHETIFSVAKNFGANVVMTSPEHPSGTDRLQQVCAECHLADEEIVVNIQGDEPLIPAAVINQVADLLARDSAASVATLCEAIESLDVFIDPNAVKVVMDDQQRALYFSRAPIPWSRDSFANGLYNATLAHKDSAAKDFAEIGLGSLPLRHLGIYAYRVALLNRFVNWPVAALEKTEKLEQLRVLANGEKIVLAKACEFVPPGVDTEDDLNRIKQLMTSSI